ncbi:MAG: hypothetical protein WCF67_22935, partial [Chitinophagaceae bacterium]
FMNRTSLANTESPQFPSVKAWFELSLFVQKKAITNSTIINKDYFIGLCITVVLPQLHPTSLLSSVLAVRGSKKCIYNNGISN